MNLGKTFHDPKNQGHMKPSFEVMETLDDVFDHP